MFEPVFYSAGHTNALEHAIDLLKQKGCSIAPSPNDQVTHLLIDVPGFESTDVLKGGGRIADMLTDLPRSITVVGGGLAQPALAGYKTVDLLQDPLYLAENADITAHCAVRLAMEHLPVTLRGCHVLVIGWGRIGKCLAALLKNMGAIVTVAARKEADRAMLLALGYDALDTAGLDYSLVRYRLICNTVPQPVISKEACAYCQKDCLKLDLASVKGIDSDDVLWARGLPNKYAPASSGELIARSILRLR